VNQGKLVTHIIWLGIVRTGVLFS